MRFIGFVAAAIIAGVLPAQAAWKEYVYTDLGVAKYFPVEPKMGKGTYGLGIRLPLSKLVPDVTLTALDEGVTYKLTIVDFKGRDADGSNIMGEAVYWLGNKGTVVSQGFPRLDLGNESVYGFVIDVDEKGGNHATSEVFFNKGKLYIVQAYAPKNSPGLLSQNIGRFIETVRFHLEGYGWDEKLGKGYPIGDDDPYDRDLGQKPAPEPPE